MKEFPKIQSVFKRDEKTHRFLVGQYALPEFEYLKDNTWVWTEKINGTNIRVIWNGTYVMFQGKTDNAQMYPKLLSKLQDIFSVGKFGTLYPDTPMTLYGEGYGAGIQKGGGSYIADGCDFILFDVLIDAWWLERQNIEDIAGKLNIRVVPIIGEGTLEEAVSSIVKWVNSPDGGFQVREHFRSAFGDFGAEGLVLKPKTALWDRKGKRIITKMKDKDF